MREELFDNDVEGLLFLLECVAYLVIFIVIVMIIFILIDNNKYKKNRAFKKPKKF